MEASAKKIAWISCLAGSLAAALLLYFFDPTRVPIYPTCLVHWLTGLDCPGCGSLRALHQLLHGNLREAFRFNPLLITMLPVLAWFGYRLVRSEITHQPLAPIRPLWLWVFLAVFLTFGALRNMPAFAVFP